MAWNARGDAIGAESRKLERKYLSEEIVSESWRAVL